MLLACVTCQDETLLSLVGTMQIDSATSTGQSSSVTVPAWLARANTLNSATLSDTHECAITPPEGWHIDPLLAVGDLSSTAGPPQSRDCATPVWVLLFPARHMVAAIREKETLSV